MPYHISSSFLPGLFYPIPLALVCILLRPPLLTRSRSCSSASTLLGSLARISHQAGSSISLMVQLYLEISNLHEGFGTGRDLFCPSSSPFDSPTRPCYDSGYHNSSPVYPLYLDVHPSLAFTLACLIGSLNTHTTETSLDFRLSTRHPHSLTKHPGHLVFPGPNYFARFYSQSPTHPIAHSPSRHDLRLRYVPPPLTHTTHLHPIRIPSKPASSSSTPPPRGPLHTPTSYIFLSTWFHL